VRPRPGFFLSGCNDATLYDERTEIHRRPGDEKAAEEDERKAMKLRNNST
jgi:hypothetical protein